MEIWYILIMVILVSLFFEHALTLHVGNVLYWLRLVAFAFVLIASIFIFLNYPRHISSQKPNYSLERTYAEQLRRKDKTIQELKKQNAMLMHTALKQAEKTREISERARQLTKQTEKEQK